MNKLISKQLRAAAILGTTLTLGFGSASAQNAAMVNNKPITKAKVDEFVAAMVQQGRPDSPQLREGVVAELISRELLLQQAEKQGVARSADVTKQLESARTEILANAVIRNHLKANPVKDTDVKAEYDRVSKEGGGKEYKTRHILVEKEEVAKKIIDDLKKGGKFEELAKQSKDPGSAAQGGDLGWANPAGFVKPFSDALVKLTKGQTTEAPVQSQFGWHVIRLEDTRESKAPSFEELKPQIQQFLTQKKITEYVTKLRGEAKIQ
jgi:peptidyl-prolyl cis-trans isomerase C